MQEPGNIEVSPELSKKLPSNFVVKGLQRSQQKRMLQYDLAIRYAPFFAIFLFHVMNGKYWGQSFFAAKAAREMLTSNELPEREVERFYEQILRPDEFYQWLEGVVIGYIWAEEGNKTLVNNPHQSGPNKISNKNVRYSIGCHQMIGAIRVRTQRVTNSSCVWTHLYGQAPEPCYGSYDSAQVDTLPFGTENQFTYQTCEESGTKRFRGRAYTYNCGGHIEELPFGATVDEAVGFVKRLSDGKFIDSYATRLVMVEMYSYCNTFDSFVDWELAVEITAGGAFWPQGHFYLFRAANFGPQYWPLGLLIFYVGFFWYRYFRGLRKAYTAATASGTDVKWYMFEYATRAWEIVEVLNLSLFVFSFYQEIRFIVISQFEDYHNLDNEMYQSFPYKLHEIHDNYQWIIYIAATNVITSSLKLLKYSALNARFDLLARTLSESAGDISGVVALFFLIVTSFAITGMALFGNAILGYRTIDASYGTLMLAVLTAFDYEELRDENGLVAALFFWSFMVLALFLLLNLFIAVVTNTFVELRTEKEAEKTRAKARAKAEHKRKQKQARALMDEEEQTEAIVVASDDSSKFMVKAKQAWLLIYGTLSLARRQMGVLLSVIDILEQTEITFNSLKRQAKANAKSQAAGRRTSITSLPNSVISEVPACVQDSVDAGDEIFSLNFDGFLSLLPEDFYDEKVEMDWFKDVWARQVFDYLAILDEDEEGDENEHEKLDQLQLLRSHTHLVGDLVKTSKSASSHLEQQHIVMDDIIKVTQSIMQLMPTYMEGVANTVGAASAKGQGLVYEVPQVPSTGVQGQTARSTFGNRFGLRSSKNIDSIGTGDEVIEIQGQGSVRFGKSSKSINRKNSQMPTAGSPRFAKNNTSG